MDVLQIYRGDDPFWLIKLNENCNQSKTIMGENVLNIQFTLSSYVPFGLNDYCTAFGETYRLYQLPIVKKTGSNAWQYTLTMRAEGFELSKALYLGLDSQNNLTESEFYLTGTADVFMDLLIQNINRISSGWEKGDIVATSFKTIGFNGENCYEVLGRLATEFTSEFSIEGKKIHIAKRSTPTGYTLQVGYNRGLKEITRVSVDNTRVITRLYPYGSDKNLPTTYVGKRLHLPQQASTGNDCLISDLTWWQSADDGYLFVSFNPPIDAGVTSIEMKYGEAGSGTFPYTKTLGLRGGPVAPAALGFSFDAKFVSHGGACEGQETPVINVTGNNPQPLFPLVPGIYIEKNVDKYGVIEDRALFDDIYPHRTGTVSSIDATDPFLIVDTSIDFDINAYLVPGLPVQLTLMTGQLAGYTFDVTEYDNGTKTIKFLQYKNEQSIVFPNATIKPEIGDQYVITNIFMPDSYIQKAEKELLDKAKAMLSMYSEPQYTIQAVLDTKYMKDYQREVFTGNTIWIKDIQMEIDRKIRIVTCVRNLVEPYQFQVTLSDIVEIGMKDKIFTSLASNQRSTNDLGNQVVSRDIFNGNLVLPPSSTAVGAVFENVLVDKNTNKLYRQE
jgi:hypothetical protein